jgi:HEAT repeat protein
MRCNLAVWLKKLDDQRAVPGLITMLRDDADEVRQEAAGALGSLRDRRAVPALMVALKDPDWNVRNQAAEALGNIGDKRAIPALKAVYAQNNRYPGERFSEALEKLRSR